MNEIAISEEDCVSSESSRTKGSVWSFNRLAALILRFHLSFSPYSSTRTKYPGCLAQAWAHLKTTTKWPASLPCCRKMSQLFTAPQPGTFRLQARTSYSHTSQASRDCAQIEALYEGSSRISEYPDHRYSAAKEEIREQQAPA